MKFAVALFVAALPAVANAQGPLQPSPPLPTVPPPPVQSHVFEPTLYCLYDGIPYSRGSRLYQGGFAMSCDAVATSTTGLVWQLVR